MIFSSTLHREQSAVVFLLEMAEVVRMLAVGEHGEDERFT
jgi:hypothetical protein